MQEIWKPAKGYEDKYLVSDKGRIKSIYRQGWRKDFLDGHITKLGYISVRINGKNILAHRLIAETFLEKIEGKNEVNHKNGVKTDNKVSNLEWVSRSENIKHCYKVLGRKPKPNYFPKSSKKIICIETKKTYRSISSVKKDGFNRCGVRNCLIGRSKTSGGYHWEYI